MTKSNNVSVRRYITRSSSASSNDEIWQRPSARPAPVKRHHSENSHSTARNYIRTPPPTPRKNSSSSASLRTTINVASLKRYNDGTAEHQGVTHLNLMEKDELGVNGSRQSVEVVQRESSVEYDRLSLLARSNPLATDMIYSDNKNSGSAASTIGLTDKYEPLRELGKGTFSVVRLAKCRKTGQMVAIKYISKRILRKQPLLNRLFIRECDILKSLTHPNIVRLMETIDNGDEETCLVMEYVDGGELYQYVERHPDGLAEGESRMIFNQLLDALNYIHRNGVAHRDLKLENILCQFTAATIISSSSNNNNTDAYASTDTRTNAAAAPPVVKIADFGFAIRFKDGDMLTERCGSEEYAAPEIIRSLPYDGKATDIWALGVILYALVTGGLPFLKDEMRPKLIYQKIILGRFEEFSDEIVLSNEVKDLIKRLLNPESTKRFKDDEIRSHPWMNLQCRI